MSQEKELIPHLEFKPIRQLFKGEAQHFTTWLEQNLEVLSDRLGIELSLVQREKAVGDFNVDLLCEDPAGRPVIIENQLEKTDHDHLGKLLTYLVNLDARAAIWVTGEPRPEHQKVIDWLNENTAADLAFYLVKVEAVCIGQSTPAPLFTVLAGPSGQTKELGEKKKEWADRHIKRMEFWKGLLDKTKEKTKLFANISPGRNNWLGTGAGRSGVAFNYVVLMDEASDELYIDHDHETGAKNKAIFDALAAQKDAIEREVGGTLEWLRLDDKRACRIQKRFTNGGLADPETWPQLQDEMIDAMIKLDKALRGRLAEVKV
jgi:hypothetical protein